MGVSPLRGFILRQAVVVLAIPFVWLTLLMKKYAPICGRRKTRVLVEFCNATGALYSVFFIAIIISGWLADVRRRQMNWELLIHAQCKGSRSCGAIGTYPLTQNDY